MKQIFDSHVHTSHSFDCASNSIDVCENAIKKELMGISITDHWEVGLHQESQFMNDIRGSIETSQRLKNNYDNKIIVSTGIELGQPHHNGSETASAMKLFDYDFVLASCHIIRGYDDFCNFRPDPDKVDVILQQYFEEVVEMISTQDFDSLGHLTYPIRYIQGIYKINVDLDRHIKIIDIILKKLIESQKSLEINTYGKRQSINDFSPSMEIVKRYKQMGGELITIGSDAHRPEHVGSHLSEVIDHLRLMEFTSYSYYIKRVPCFIPISL